MIAKCGSLVVTHEKRVIVVQPSRKTIATTKMMPLVTIRVPELCQLASGARFPVENSKRTVEISRK